MKTHYKSVDKNSPVNIQNSGVDRLVYPPLLLQFLVVSVIFIIKHLATAIYSTLGHYHLEVQANPKKMAQKNRCYF